MTPTPTSPLDDLTAVRLALGPANPAPDATLPREDVLAARAAVGMARVLPPPARRLRGRFVAAGAVAVLSVATLVALVAMPARQGSDTTNLATGPGAKAIGAASAATQAAGTARGLLTVTSQGHTVTATGIGNFGTGDASAEISLGGQDIPTTERLPGGPRTPGGPSDGATVTVVRTGAGIYARLPGGMNPLSSTKPWVSVDAATMAQLTKLAVGDIGAQITGAPLDALTYLRAVSGDVQVVGPDTTRNEPTTHYRATVDAGKAAAQLPEALRREASTQAAGQSLPAELWIDAQGRLRKLEITTPPVVLPSGRGAFAADRPATVILELFDFGIPVKVTAPPADQVAELGGLLGTFLQNVKRP